MISDAGERRLWSTIIETVALAGCVFCIHDALWSILAKFLAVIASSTCRAHVRSRVSRHQATMGAVAGMCRVCRSRRSRGVRFARKGSAECITANVVGGLAMLK